MTVGDQEEEPPASLGVDPSPNPRSSRFRLPLLAMDGVRPRAMERESLNVWVRGEVIAEYASIIVFTLLQRFFAAGRPPSEGTDTCTSPVVAWTTIIAAAAAAEPLWLVVVLADDNEAAVSFFSRAASAAAASTALRAASCASTSASESVLPGNHSRGICLAMNPTGSATTPMTRHTTHSLAVRFMKPMAGPTTERPTPSMNAACTAIVATRMPQKMGDSSRFSNTFTSVILRELISENTCMKTKALKMTELRRSVW
mmetsp:Transcript_4308/g.10427  ORF Transcript_4308/g.10427 Transcript_4308/m.10427 type:complete len:257 (+) Transcript_4308:1372-2142(+)